jgi:2-hydroxy-6-oxonona-2,4-dienedioate hydrolase
MKPDFATVPMPAVMHRQLDTPRGALHYVEAGTGEPLLLVHGGHGSWKHWIANIDTLAKHRRVLALDLAGFGASYDPGRPLTLDEYVVDAGTLLDTLHLDGVAVAGFSFGTLVAAGLAAAWPDSVRSLAMINPPGLGTRSAQALALPGTLSSLAKAGGLRAGVAGTLQQLMLRDASLSTPALIDLIAHCINETRYVTRMISRHADMLALLNKAPQKKLILLGQFDPYQRHHVEQDACWLKQQLGDQAIRIVPNCAHWLQFEQADAFHRLLLDFITPR